MQVFLQIQAIKLAHDMYKNQTNPDQTSLNLEALSTPFSKHLDPNNRWIKLASLIQWDQFEQRYASLFSTNKGAPAISFRIALASLLLKEKLQLTDRELVQQLCENPYLQYFIGLPTFTDKVPFHHSMLSHFRKRIKPEIIEEINESIIANHQSRDKVDKQSDSADEKQASNQGKLLLDASCAPSDIRYPTDLSLLNEAREKTEQIIDVLWQHCEKKANELKPRTYRKIARKDFLSIIRKRKNSRSQIRKGIRKQLEHLKRNLGYINFLKSRVSLEVLSSLQYKNLLVVSELYRQQHFMYKKGVHRIDTRIVSISQPHIRPIVRGKAASPVEFGAKISISDVDGFVYLDRLEWESYHEGEDLVIQAEAFKSRYGMWPESIHADKAYRNRSNIKWCKERGIRLSGSKPGRPPKETESNRDELRRQKKEARQDEIDRIEVESKFGIAKRRYGLGRVMSRTRVSSEVMISMTILVLNIDKILRHLFCLYRKQGIFEYLEEILDRMWSPFEPKKLQQQE